MGLKAIVRYKGEFDLHELYNLIRNFFIQRDFEFHEKRYKDKGAEVKINMDPEREYDEYYKVIFKIFIHVQDAKRIEMVRLGKPRTLMKGRVQIEFDSEYKEDYGPIPIFSKKEGTMYKIFRSVTQRERDEYWDVLTLGMQQDLIAEVKAFFKMYDSGN